MYWKNYTESRLIFSRDEKPTAKKEHECCECGGTIKIGEKYSYFVGLWGDGYYYGYAKQFGAYKTCLECEKDWGEILEVFHENREEEACRVSGLLEEAIQDAFDEDFLKEGDRLVKEWLGIEPEVDVENLSPEEREEYERKDTIAQMKAHNIPLL